MFSDLVNRLFGMLSEISVDTLLYIAWGGYLGVFLIALILTVTVKRVRRAMKGVFLSFTNIFTAVTLCAYLTANEFAQSVLGAALFWCVGYLLYGILCFCSFESAKKKEEHFASESVTIQSFAPPKPVRNGLPPMESNVKPEYALAVCDKLLSKNLGKSDRQEIEKMQFTLEMLGKKGTLTPDESEILNDNFNALLKLMAKYDV